MSDGLTMMERLERTGSFLPKGVAYGVSEGRNGVRFVTYADLLAARKAKQAAYLKWLLEVPRTRCAGFVWTFWTPGIGGFAYRGWWCYLRTLEGDEAVDFRGFNEPLARSMMEMFPCGVLPAVENFNQWKEAFAVEHHRPGRFRKQGLAPVWINLDAVNRSVRHLEYA